MRPANKQHVREFVKGGRAALVNHSLDEGLCLKDTRNHPSVDPNCELFPEGPTIPVPPSSSPYRPAGVCGNYWAVSSGRHAKRKPPSQRVRRPLFPLFSWWLCHATMPKQYHAVLSGTKTRDSPDTAEPPVEEDVALGGHSDRDHGVISRQPLGTPTLSKPMSRKSSNRLSSSPLHGSAASPILASRW